MEDLKGAGSSGDEKDTGDNKGKFLNPTPILDELEGGKWPSFITGFKELGERTEKTHDSRSSGSTGIFLQN